MDKRTFLTELEKSLRILKEEELRDIISEYEQHIDMKVSSGLTEEAAIADFGSLEELKAEILAAYHVRSDYEVEQCGRMVEKASDGAGAVHAVREDTGEQASAQQTSLDGIDSLAGQERGIWMKLKTAGHWCWSRAQGIGSWCWSRAQGIGSWCWRHVKGISIWFWKGLSGIGGWCVTKLERAAGVAAAIVPWTRSGEEDVDMVEQTAEGDEELYEEEGTENIAENTVGSAAGDAAENTVETPVKIAGRYTAVPKSSKPSGRKTQASAGLFSWMKGGIHGMWNGTCRLCGWTIRAAWWCVKACWNIWWLGVSLTLGACALMSLFCLGVVAVLWTQGYPLAGVTIGCLGVVLGLCAATGFGFTLLCHLWEKPGEVPKAEEKMEVIQNA